MEHERFLIGKDPADIELLWQACTLSAMARRSDTELGDQRRRNRPMDILGQALEVPIYKLLGGAARSRIRMYLDVGSTPEDFLRAKELGYTAAKTTPLSPVKDVVHPSSMIRETVRQTPKPSAKPLATIFDIAVDAHGRCTTTMAIDFCTRVEDSGYCSSRSRPSSRTSRARLAQAADETHLATGERSFTKYGFADFCSRHLVDYIQPDVCHAGGISS